MHKTSLPEWLLARLTDRDRAAAILGDLTEMAATRGRLWFVTAYARTLITLGWRTPVAVVAAVVSVKYVRRFGLSGLLYTLHLSATSFNGIRLWYQQHNYLAHLAHFSWIASLSAVFTLWILLPYAAFRFGVRNRLTYLAGTLFLLGLPVYTLRPQIYLFTGLACALVVVAALASPLWRWQMFFLAANYPICRLTFYVCVVDPLGIFHRHHYLGPMDFFGMRIDDPVAIAITVMIGPLLYRWLVQPRLSGGTHVEPA
jgi:hypothetical protein